MTLPTPTTAEISEFSSLITSLAPQSQDLLAASTSALPTNLPSTSDISSHDALLKLKSALLLSYTQHLAVLSSHKLLGLSIDSDEQGKQLVHNLVTTRLTLEKLRPVEARLKPRYERCIRAYDLEQKKALLQGEKGSDDIANGQGEEDELDALSFRPNPSALLNASSSSSSSSKKDPSRRKSKKENSDEEDDDGPSSNAGVYKPPKLAPVPYNEEAQRRRKSRRDDGSDDGADSDDGNTRSARNRRALNAHLLQDMTSSLSSNPYAQTSSGLSRDKSHQSKRARKLQEMEDFEEANFTRLVQSKKEQRKRRRDEEDVALGGVTTAGLSNNKVGGGFEEEFGDLLRGSDRSSRSGAGSRKEWDDLVQKRKKGGSRLDAPSGNGRKSSSSSGQGRSSGNRFEKAVKSHSRKSR